MYARVEDLHEDSLYFLLGAGLLGRVEHGKKLNSKHAATNTEQRWRADTRLLIKLFTSPLFQFLEVGGPSSDPLSGRGLVIQE